jgi:ABC-type transport system involved in multi-copper enzyme maturation permease subunit
MKYLAMLFLTIREAVLQWTLLFYFAMGNCIILFFAYALALSPTDSSMITFFGEPLAPRNIGGLNPIDFILIQVQRSSTSSILLFGVFAVAGLIPSMLEKGTIEVYLSKPLSRGGLLLSRALGAATGVAVNLLYFAIGIWLVFGLKLGIWHGSFLLSFVVVTLAFFLFFSVVTFAGVITRSTGFSIMLAFLYTFFSAALESREMALFKIWDNEVYHTALDVLYYITPQLSSMLDNASRVIGELPMGPNSGHAFDLLPFVYSLLSASALYALSIRYFAKQDY